MAGKQLTIAILFKAIDQLLGPARNIVRAIEDVDKAAARAKGLRAMGDDLGKIGDQLQKIGIGATAAGFGIAHVSGLTAVPGLAIAAQHDLLAIANTADLSEREVRMASTALRVLARDVNQYEADLLKGLGVLTAAGLSFGDSMGALPAIGRTATAEVAGVEDLAKTSFALLDNLKLPVGQLAKTLDMLATAGHAGRFELKDMAQFFPLLTAQAQKLAMEGAPAALSLAAALQVAMKAAGSAPEGATNLQNFLNKITSPETKRNFAKFGVNLEQDLTAAMRRGEDPILHMAQLIQRVTGGNQFKVSEIFGDTQVLGFLSAILPRIELYEKLKRDAANGGVVDKDFERIMRSVAEQSKLFRINMTGIGERAFAKPLAALERVLGFMNAHPALQWGVAVSAGLLVVFGTLSLGLGTFLKLAGMTMTNIGALKVGFAAFRLGLLGGVGELTGGARVLALLGTGLRTATVATWGFTTALLANPITWIVVGAATLAGLGYLIYRNWSRIGEVFRGVWRWLVDAGARMRDAGANLVDQLWVGIRAVASKPVEAFRAIVQRIRNHLPFSPAKEGPLRDLHRVRIVETLASTMQPAPVLRAMRTVALATATSGAALGAQLPSTPNAGSVVQLHYAPQITIGAGATSEILPQVQAMLEAERRRLEGMIRQLEHDRARTSFSGR